LAVGIANSYKTNELMAVAHVLASIFHVKNFPGLIAMPKIACL
jgi:hypothetical protein